MSEDCLYLNVYTPAGTDGGINGNARKGISVMVFIHGQSYSYGSAGLYDARVLSALADIVVVTFNYRLGLLGFLNPNPNPETRGSVSNYGLVDQMAALQWVNENIHSFGGNPESVTLVGHGHGAAAVELLVHSPMIRQSHFQRVILMSGSMFAPWARVNNPVQVAVTVARKLGCSIPADLKTNHNEIIHCLKSKPLDSLLNVDLGSMPTFLTHIGPSIDGVTLKHNFNDIRRNKRFRRSFESRSYDTLIGINHVEWAHQLGETKLRQGLTPKERDEVLNILVTNIYNNHLREIFLAVKNEYTDYKELEESVDPARLMLNQTLAAITDALYTAPAIHSAGTFVKRRNNTYVYEWTHSDKYAGQSVQNLGSLHGDEVPYLFGIPICNVWQHPTRKYTRSEAALSAIMITYFANFIKTGDPHQPESIDKILATRNDAKRIKLTEWEKFVERKSNFLHIDVKPEMEQNFKEHEVQLWLQLIPDLEHSTPSLSRGTQGPGEAGTLWGVTRNLTNMHEFQQMPLGDKFACKDKKEDANADKDHRETFTLGIIIGSTLLTINVVFIFCICYNRQTNRSRWEMEQRGSSEGFANSESQILTGFTPPMRTATLHRQAKHPDRHHSSSELGYPMLDDKQQRGKTSADYYTLQYKRRASPGPPGSADLRQAGRANDNTGLVGGASTFQCAAKQQGQNNVSRTGTTVGLSAYGSGGMVEPSGGSILVDTKMAMCSDVPLLSDIPVPSQFKDQSSQKNIKHHIPDSIPI